MQSPHEHGHVQLNQYLYVRVVKARDLFAKFVTDGCDRYVEVRLGNRNVATRHLTLSEKKPNPKWNQVFAFLISKIDATMVEVTVKDTDIMKDEFVGCVLKDLSVIPKRIPTDDPINPKWYRLVDRKGDKLIKGDLMLALWWGTQDDEAFHEVGSVGVIDDDDDDHHHRFGIHSKVYFPPILWYLTVKVIEVQDLIRGDSSRSPEWFVKANLGNQSTKTRISVNPPFLNEELMFVAEEPFKENLVLSVEDPDKKDILGMCVISLGYVDWRSDYRTIHSRWFNLQRDVNVGGQKTKQAEFYGKIHTRICFEGGYHVQHEYADYISDFRPAAKQLWKKSIGILELGILSAHGLSPTKDGHATTDAYCVAKYGRKWVRTKTIIDSFTPKWDEHYSWEVFDPCTILTIGVFDNNFHLQGGDKKIGKVRIRVSTLETGRAYTHSYPLLALQPSGVKKMGEINLIVKFTCLSLLNMMYMYSQPVLPEMHYTHPLTVTQVNSLRHHAAQIVSMRLSQSEAPLGKEVVEYMLDVGCDMWSMRRSRANFLRIKKLFGGLIVVGKWLGEIYSWKNAISNVVIHIIFYILLTMYPVHSVIPSIFVIVAWNYKHRPMYPPHMDARLSCADNAHRDELDEEFDAFTTTRPADIVKMRYDRLRSEYGSIQRVVGDIATQGERIQSLLTWRDPIATSLFVMFCFITAIVLYATPFYAVVGQTVIYVLNKLCFQNKLPSVPVNFFRRLPSRADSML